MWILYLFKESCTLDERRLIKPEFFACMIIWIVGNVICCFVFGYIPHATPLQVVGSRGFIIKFWMRSMLACSWLCGFLDWCMFGAIGHSFMFVVGRMENLFFFFSFFFSFQFGFYTQLNLVCNKLCMNKDVAIDWHEWETWLRESNALKRVCYQFSFIYVLICLQIIE